MHVAVFMKELSAWVSSYTNYPAWQHHAGCQQAMILAWEGLANGSSENHYLAARMP